MVSKKLTYIIFIGIAVILVGAAHYNPFITGMTVLEGNEPVLIDVRTLPEYIEKRIPDSILMPYDTISTEITESFPDKDTEIVVYCRSGRRSAIAKNTLESMGYTNVKDLGGIIDWKGPTISGPN